MIDERTHAKETSLAKLAPIGTSEWYCERWDNRWQSLDKAIQNFQDEIDKTMLEQMRQDLKSSENASSPDWGPSSELIEWFEDFNPKSDEKFTPLDIQEIKRLADYFSHGMSSDREAFYPAIHVYIRARKCRDLLEQLHDFGNTIFEFFRDGFYKSKDREAYLLDGLELHIGDVRQLLRTEAIEPPAMEKVEQLASVLQNVVGRLDKEQEKKQVEKVIKDLEQMNSAALQTSVDQIVAKFKQVEGKLEHDVLLQQLKQTKVDRPETATGLKEILAKLSENLFQSHGGLGFDITNLDDRMRAVENLLSGQHAITAALQPEEQSLAKGARDQLFAVQEKLQKLSEKSFTVGERLREMIQIIGETPIRAGLMAATEKLRFASQKYSPNYILRILLQQISIDLNLIQQAFHQSVQLGQRENLIVADTLAHFAIQPALQSGFLDQWYASVLTFRDRRVEVRLLPYHDVVLMSIPFAAHSSGTEFNATPDRQRPSTDYLAIPHEIGHLLYQHGQLPTENGKIHFQTEVRLRLLDNLPTTDWRFDWLEEIFSDAYGCLIAGPISVLSMQELLGDGLPDDEHSREKAYPIQILRPLIQTQILRSITDPYGNHPFKEAPDLLDAHWRQWVKKYWPRWVKQHWPYGYNAQKDILKDAIYQINGTPRSGGEILTDLQIVIDIILETLAKLRPENAAHTWTPTWTPNDYKEDEKIAALYASFAQFASTEMVQEASKMLYNELAKNTTRAEANGKYRWFTKALQQLDAQDLSNPGIDDLVDLILFQGWSDDGPDGNPIKKN